MSKAVWNVVASLRGEPHPNLQSLSNFPDLCENLPIGVAEVLEEAVIVQHLMDSINIPLGTTYDKDIDVRVYQAVEIHKDMKMRLERIAEAHTKYVDVHGGTYGECVECGAQWPCPTFIWSKPGRTSTNTWYPDDDDYTDYSN